MGESDAADAGTLRITLEFLRQESSDDPYLFQEGLQRYLLRDAGGRYFAGELDWNARLLGDLTALRQPGFDPSLVQRLGNLLRKFLQPMEWSAQEAELSRALRRGQSVVFAIRSAAAELYTLPWELLSLGGSGGRLGAQPSVLLVYEWPGSAPQQAPQSPRREDERVLFCWSAAAGGVPNAEQLQAITQAAQQGGWAFDPARDVLSHTSLDALTGALGRARRDGPPVSLLHILCHGGEAGSGYGLCLDGERPGERVVVDAGRLGDALAEFADMVQAIVVSACDSGNAGALGNQLGSVAQVLHRAGFPMVLASRYPLSVNGSVRLTQQLYGDLLGNLRSFEDATRAARSALVRDASQMDWASLQLYMHMPTATGPIREGGAGEPATDHRPLTMRPYRGLLSFQPEHRRFFFGRDRETAEIRSDAAALIEGGRPRLLAVDGASGTGKSSVVFAGALPPLLDLWSRPSSPAICARMRPGGDPLSALDRALSATDVAARIVLIVDQFEELFTHVAERQTRLRFARALWQLATQAEGRVFVLLTIRSDYVGRCGELLLDAPDDPAGQGLRLDRVIYDEGHRVSIAQMGAAELRQAIVGPAHRVGLQLDPGLAERMLADVAHEPGALPLLSDTLDLLWTRRDGARLRQATYDELGGVTGALQRRADALIDALTAQEQQVARRLLVRLVHSGDGQSPDTRRRIDVAARRPNAPDLAAAFDRVLARLADARLLVISQEADRSLVEVAHEALLRRWGRLTTWVQADRKLLTELNKVEAWVQEWRERGTLLSGNQLGYAAEVARSSGEELSSDAHTLLQRSEGEHGRLLERERVMRDMLRVRQAEDLRYDPSRAVAVLREVESADPTQLRGFLPLVLDILQCHALLTEEIDDRHGSVISLRFSGDGRALWVASEDGTVQSWLIDGDLRPGELYSGLPLSERARMSHDATHIASVVAGAACITDVSTGQQRLLAGPALQPDAELTFSADGRRLAVAQGTHLWLWDLAAGDSASLLPHADTWVPSDIVHVCFSRDGQRVYGCDLVGQIQGWRTDGTATPGMRLDLSESSERLLTMAATDVPEQLRVLYGPRYEPRGALCDLATGGIIERSTHDLSRPRPDLIVWSDDGRYIAAGSQDLQVQSTEAPATALWLYGHRAAVRHACFSPDNRLLATGDENGVVRIWNLTRPAGLRGTALLAPAPAPTDTDPPETPPLPLDCAFSADGRSVLARRRQAPVWSWSLPQPPAAQVHATAQPAPESTDLRSPDEKWTVALDDAGALILRPADGHGAPTRLTIHNPIPSLDGVQFSPDSSHLLVAISGQSQVYLWNLPSAIHDGSYLLLAEEDSTLRFARFSADSQRLLVVGDVTRLWSITGEPLRAVTDPHQRCSVTAALFAPDGETILLVEHESSRLWRPDGRRDPFNQLSARGETFVLDIDPGWTQLLERGPRGLSVWELDVKPQSLLRRLWGATRFRLSADERQRLLFESRDEARARDAFAWGRLNQVDPVR